MLMFSELGSVCNSFFSEFMELEIRSNTFVDKVAVDESSQEYTDNEEENYGFNFSTLR